MFLIKIRRCKRLQDVELFSGLGHWACDRPFVYSVYNVFTERTRTSAADRPSVMHKTLEYAFSFRELGSVCGNV
jgi:hypothetical protein